MKAAVKLLTLSIALAAILVASCNPRKADDTSGSEDAAFTEYQVIEFSQPQHTPNRITFDGALKQDFEKKCSEMLQAGWQPAGGIAVTFDESGRRVMGYAQAFYR